MSNELSLADRIINNEVMDVFNHLNPDGIPPWGETTIAVDKGDIPHEIDPDLGYDTEARGYRILIRDEDEDTQFDAIRCDDGKYLYHSPITGETKRAEPEDIVILGLLVEGRNSAERIDGSKTATAERLGNSIWTATLGPKQYRLVSDGDTRVIAIDDEGQELWGNTRYRLRHKLVPII